MTTPTRPTNDDIRAQIIAGLVNPAVVNTRELMREVVAERDALIAAGGCAVRDELELDPCEICDEPAPAACYEGRAHCEDCQLRCPDCCDVFREDAAHEASDRRRKGE